MREWLGVTARPAKRQLKREMRRIPAAFAGDGIQGRGSLSKLSRSGLFFTSEDLPKPGDSVRIAFNDLDGNKITVEGIVRWNTAHIEPNSSGFEVELKGDLDPYLGFFAQILTS